MSCPFVGRIRRFDPDFWLGRVYFALASHDGKRELLELPKAAGFEGSGLPRAFLHRTPKFCQDSLDFAEEVFKQDHRTAIFISDKLGRSIRMAVVKFVSPPRPVCVINAVNPLSLRVVERA